MERKLAELVVKNLEGHHGPILSVSEAMSMTKVVTDAGELYAIQKGAITFLARFATTEMTYLVQTKTVSW